MYPLTEENKSISVDRIINEINNMVSYGIEAKFIKIEPKDIMVSTYTFDYESKMLKINFADMTTKTLILTSD